MDGGEESAEMASNDTADVGDSAQLPDVPPALPQKKRSSLLKKTTRLFGFGLLGYVGLVGLLAINEPMMVYPASKYPRGNWQPDFPFEEVSFEAHDHIKICGWYLPQEGATETVLVCHGNAENAAQSSASTGLRFRDTLNANVLVYDYRGYGKSEGTPFEEVILMDTELAMKWLNEKTGTQPQDVIVVGHSIGGGPAVHVVSKLGAKAMFLQRTFASLVEPAAEKYWFVPVNLIMQNRYPSAEKIKNCNVPLHQSHPEKDTLVSFDSGRKLFDASPAALKEFYVFKGANHWDALPPEYWASVQVFLNRINEQ